MGTNKNYMQDNMTFLKLIGDYKITIPVIQRDYAQGRTSPKVTEIRDGFLSAIIDVLQSNDRKHLVLDFIYGSTDSEEIFTPLDGQQRLTTLFLIYWYLADTNTLEQLKTKDDISVFSKFSYETRISSKNFCDKLVQQDYSEIKQSYDTMLQGLHKGLEELNTKIENCINETEKNELIIKAEKLNNQTNKWTFSSTIKDQPWFLWAWQKDPTVTSMLTMLDDVDSRLADIANELRNEYLNRLNKIVFHLLPLEQFNLTDELYVKMNARGKELSEFDNLKSTLEEQMRLNNVKEKIQHTWQTNFDSDWVDIFWNKIAKPKLKGNVNDEFQKETVKEVEIAYLRFLKRMMTYHLFINDECIVGDWNNKAIKRYIPFDYTEDDNILNKLRDFSVRNDILKLVPLFCKTHFFSESFFKYIVNAFESLIFNEVETKKDGSCLIDNIGFEHNQDSLFEAFIAESINYDTRVQFFALLKFLEYNAASNLSNNPNIIKELNSWMRVIRNLSTNTNTYYYNTYEDFLKSLMTIQNWCTTVYKKDSSTILKYISDEQNLSGFDGGQLKEEQIKANLILKDNEWNSNINEIEEHKYFLGQIRFLLNWSKDGYEEYQLNEFKKYVEKIRFVFDDTGLVEHLKENHRFKNSLMCVDNWYLLNDCFVKYDNNKDRDWSWKRYLRDDKKALNIKNLLDDWEKQQQPDIGKYCESFIESKNPPDWRKCFIEYPEIYDNLYDKKVSWWYWDDEKDFGDICLLSKTRWSSRHKELRSYYWFLKHRETDNDLYLDSTEETHPFSAIFKRINEKEFSLKYLPKWDNGWKQGQYVISSNFDCSAYGMVQNIENGRWEKYFSSDCIDEVESLLQKLNNL